MVAGLLSIVAVVVALAMLPMALRWLQARVALRQPNGHSRDRIVSVLAVGPQQRVVTVEVGPPQARVWLTLGVTAQQVNTLHTAPATSSLQDLSQPPGA